MTMNASRSNVPNRPDASRSNVPNRPGPNPNVKVPGYSIRQVTMNDVEAINELAKQESFNIGLHNLRMYIAQSPDTWHVIVHEDTQEIVAYDSYNKLPHDCYFGYNIVVSDKHKGRGITRMFNSMTYATFSMMGNATNDAMLRYSFESFKQKFIGQLQMDANARPKVDRVKIPDGIRVLKITAANIEQVLDYDCDTIGFTERRQFMRQWILNANFSESIVAMDANGEVVGYTTVRVFCDQGDVNAYRSPTPLYADTPEISTCLLEMSLAILKPEDCFYVHHLASQRSMFEVLRKYKATREDVETRQSCTGCQQRIENNLKWHRVYTDHEYWPL